MKISLKCIRSEKLAFFSLCIYFPNIICDPINTQMFHNWLIFISSKHVNTLKFIRRDCCQHHSRPYVARVCNIFNTLQSSILSGDHLNATAIAIAFVYLLHVTPFGSLCNVPPCWKLSFSFFVLIIICGVFNFWKLG